MLLEFLTQLTDGALRNVQPALRSNQFVLRRVHPLGHYAQLVSQITVLFIRDPKSMTYCRGIRLQLDNPIRRRDGISLCAFELEAQLQNFDICSCESFLGILEHSFTLLTPGTGGCEFLNLLLKTLDEDVFARNDRIVALLETVIKGA